MKEFIHHLFLNFKNREMVVVCKSKIITTYRFANNTKKKKHILEEKAKFTM